MTPVAAAVESSPPPTSFDRWRDRVLEPMSIRSSVLLALTVGAAALVFVMARRSGHWWGDDWALYLRQADGLLHLDPGRVAAENEFNLEHSLGPPFTPPIYPWGFPLVLVPFVAIFGDDIDGLALVSTFAACAFAWCWYLLARPRVGEAAALLGAFAAVTTPLLVLWSELIQSEWTFLAVVGLVFVGLDRVVADGALIDINRSITPLVLLGVGAACAFSVRREGFALTPAVAVAQLVALQSGGYFRRPFVRGRDLRRLTGRLLAPHATALAVVLFVLVTLPSTLVPSYDGTSVWNVGRFADAHVEHIAEVSGVKLPWQDAPTILGNAAAGWVAMVVYFAAGLIGIVLAVTVNRRRDAQFVCYIVVALIIGGSFRSALNRYMASIAPLVLLLGLVALATIGARLRSRTAGLSLVLLPVVVLVAGNIGRAADRIEISNEFADNGRVEWGPAHPDAVAMYEAVLERTGDDAVIGAPKARAMTWATGRQAVQVGTAWRVPTAIRVDAIVIETDDDLVDDLTESPDWTQTWTGRRFVMFEPAASGG